MTDGLAGLLPRNVQWAFQLIGYSCVVILAGWFLLIGSRRPAPSQRREAFRTPARFRAMGYLLLASDAMFILTRLGIALWEVVLSVVWLVLGVVVTYVGYRKYARASDAYPPGKHAGPLSPRESRWQRRPLVVCWLAAPVALAR